MKQSSIRELFDYWNQRRGNRAAPERADIEPGAIRRALADTFILGFDAHVGHPFRIAGTRVCAAFGRELKGEPFTDLWAQDSRQAIRDLVNVIAGESVGVVAGASAQNAEGATLALELLILPLGHRGRAGARLIGALAATETPYWLGTETLASLSLGTLRYLDSNLPAHANSPIGLLAPSRLRHGWVVYDGGRP